MRPDFPAVTGEPSLTDATQGHRIGWHQTRPRIVNEVSRTGAGGGMDIIREWWGLIVSGATLVAWLVRIEQKTKENAKDIDAIRQQRSEDLQAHREAREATNEVLKEMRADIKELLRKVGS